jgi:hypothetical protein
MKNNDGWKMEGMGGSLSASTHHKEWAFVTVSGNRGDTLK